MGASLLALAKSIYYEINRAYDLRFDKALETDLWSHKQATSFPCEKSVQNLNWVADWLLPRPQGINAVTVNLIGCMKKLHRMRLKTGCNCDVHN